MGIGTLENLRGLMACRSTAVRSLGKAVDSIRMLSRQQPNLRVKVLVTGSLYLVGDVMKMLKDGPN